MKKSLLLLTVILLSMNFAFAQRKCGTMPYWEQQKALDPTLAEKSENLERWVQEVIKAKKFTADTATNTIYIPIVFHIVYKTSAQNVSDACVYEQLNYMNADYGGLNPHSMYSFPSNLKANTKIQFCMAQRKPDGTPTNGIERRQTNVNSFSTNNAVKKYATGGMDPWDWNSYMNVWVCNMGGGILGYGQFPASGINATYGLVLHYDAFGHSCASYPYNLGGTGSHEFGHCFNLRHIWGDDGNACTGTDFCNDTPNQADENYGTPPFPTISCGNGPLGDMFMNFMDYSDDLALANFTPDQTDRMLALFAAGGPLYSLTSSLGCQAPTCDVPNGINATPFGYTNVVLNWIPTPIQEGTHLQYQLQGDTVWTDTTLIGATVNSLTLNNLLSGNFYEWRVRSLCATDTSDFSAVNVFFTAECSDSFEPNNVMSAAVGIGPNESNDTINGMLDTHSDIDWYRFAMTNYKNVTLRLQSLPGNYDLRVYRSNGVLLIKSTLSGTTDEEVILHSLKNGNYYISISGADSSIMDCYTLYLERNVTPVAVDKRKYNIETPGTGHARLSVPALGVYPNPASGEVNISILAETATTAHVSLLNITGSIMLERDFDLIEGSNLMKLDLTRLVPGIYLVKVEQNDQTSYSRLVVR